MNTRCSPNLKESEWNFEKVPEKELAPCFYYEFAREFAKQSLPWQTLIRQLRSAQKGKRPKGDSLKISRRILQMFPTFPVAHLFLLPDLAQVPWAELAAEYKAEIIEQWKHQVDRAETFRESISLIITLQQELPEWKGIRNFEDWVLMDMCWHPGLDHQREYGFVAINWNYTDYQLRKEFSKWLLDKRGLRRAVESRRGKNKMRQNLSALGAKRLLESGFTANQATDHTSRVLKARPLYGALRSWYDAKNLVVPEILKKLFPGSSCEQEM